MTSRAGTSIPKSRPGKRKSTKQLDVQMHENYSTKYSKIVKLRLTVNSLRKDRAILQLKVIEQQAEIANLRQQVVNTVVPIRDNDDPAIDGTAGKNVGSYNGNCKETNISGILQPHHALCNLDVLQYHFSSMAALATFSRETSCSPQPLTRGCVKFIVTLETLEEEHQLPKHSLELSHARSRCHKEDDYRSYEAADKAYKAWKLMCDSLNSYSFQYWNATYKFLSKFGNHVRCLTIAQEDCGITPEILFKIVEGCLEHVPQLKRLVVEVRFTQTVNAPRRMGKGIGALPPKPSILSSLCTFVQSVKSSTFQSTASLEAIVFALTETVPKKQLQCLNWQTGIRKYIGWMDEHMYNSDLWTKLPVLQSVTIQLDHTSKVSDYSSPSSFTSDEVKTETATFSEFTFEKDSDIPQQRITYACTRDGYRNYKSK